MTGAGAVRGLDLLLIASIGLFWGLNWPAVRVLLEVFEPFTLRTIAFTLGAAGLLLLARLRGDRLWPARNEIVALSVAGLFTVTGFNVLTAFAQLATDTSKAVLIAFTMPVWAALLSAPMLGEKSSVTHGLALALAMAGLALLATPRTGESGFDSGSLLALGAALSWAIGTVLLKRRAWSLPPLSRAAWLIAVSVPVVGVAALLTETPFAPGLPDRRTILVLAYHVALPMIFCHAAWVVLVTRLPASLAAIGTMSVPLVGFSSAIVLLGEPATAARVAALVLIMAGLVLALLPGRVAMNSRLRSF